MKKAFIIFAIISIFIAFSLGFLVSVVSRFALFEAVISLTPTANLLQEANILVLGVDDAAGHRSDTIMVVHIDPDKKEVAVVAIPRDTLVTIPDRGLDKINHAYAYGGVDLAKRTVEKFLHINISHHVMVNLAGIEELIDKLGGIIINVEKRMYYVDYAQDLNIDLMPGVQRLNGHQAMGYLRFRHTDNDFARINRQQVFLRAVVTEMLKRENIFKTPGVFLSLLSCIDTDLSSRQTLALALSLRRASELNQINMTTTPGSDLMVDGVYYYRPDEIKLRRIVEQFLSGKGLVSSTGGL